VQHWYIQYGHRQHIGGLAYLLGDFKEAPDHSRCRRCYVLVCSGPLYGQWVVYVVEAVGVGGWAGNLHFGYGVPGK
jgi:hypothetical protein